MDVAVNGAHNDIIGRAEQVALLSRTHREGHVESTEGCPKPRMAKMTTGRRGNRGTNDGGVRGWGSLRRLQAGKGNWKTSGI